LKSEGSSSSIPLEVLRYNLVNTLAKSEQEALEWVQMIQKAALMNRPNMVLKIVISIIIIGSCKSRARWANKSDYVLRNENPRRKGGSRARGRYSPTDVCCYSISLNI